MRYLIIALMLLTTMVNAQNEVNITGKILGIDTDKAVLLHFGNAISDTVPVVGGNYSLSAKDIVVDSYVVEFIETGIYLPLVLEPCNMEVIASKYQIDGNYINKSIITGSKLHDVLAELRFVYRKGFEKIPDDEIEHYHKMMAIQAKRGLTDEEKDFYEPWREKYIPILLEEYAKSAFALMKKHADEPVIMLLLNEVAGYLSPAQLKEVVNLIPDEIMADRHMVDYRHMKSDNGDKNANAYDFTLEDLNGNMHSLSDFKGKYVLLDFWASWCGPCKEAMPHTAHLHEKYKDKGLQVININLDVSEENWRDDSKDLKITWLNLHARKDKDGSNKVANRYLITALPTVVFIDPEGNIIFQGAGVEGEDLNKLLKEHLGE